MSQRKGTLEQRKEFLRGFVHENSIDPDAARGTITFYELPISSLMMVPGARVALLKMIPSKNLDRFAVNEAWRVAA